jgi:hypothetical protein
MGSVESARLGIADCGALESSPNAGDALVDLDHQCGVLGEPLGWVRFGGEVTANVSSVED